MTLIIENDEIERLVTELALRTGETPADAVGAAVRERLGRLRTEQEGLAERLMAIGRECASRLAEPYRSIEHAELLYGGKHRDA